MRDVKASIRMMTASLFTALALAAFVSSAPVEKRGSTLSRAGYSTTPLFRDDFTSSSSLSSNWNYDIGTSYPGQSKTSPQWGTGELESYTSSPSNIFVQSGYLHIVPIKTNSNGKSWTSARIETKKEFQCFSGGKMLIEGYINLGSAATSQQGGIWPAFWAMGKNFRTQGNKGWPASGEWDIMESINGARQTWGSVHCGTTSPENGGPCNEPNGKGWSVKGTSRGTWVLYSFEVDRTSKNWQTEKVTWYINGVSQFTITGANIGNQAAWTNLLYQPFFLILNVAVGGPFAASQGGVPSSSTTSGSAVGMQVDYVVVWRT